jgi:hypothetical protein
MFTVFNNHLSNAGIVLKGGSSSSFDGITALPADRQAYLRDQARSAIALSFFALSSFSWLGVIVVAFLGNVKITKDGKDSESKGVSDTGVRDFSQNVIEGSYIGSLFRRRNIPVKAGDTKSNTQPDAEKGLSS